MVDVLNVVCAEIGVPLKRSVAGVAMGLILNPDGRFVVLTDILGSEDALGDMDFKVAGDADGVTAFQMDIKVYSTWAWTRLSHRQKCIDEVKGLQGQGVTLLGVRSGFLPVQATVKNTPELCIIWPRTISAG